MRLLHHSDNFIKKVVSKKQNNEMFSWTGKPYGFWVSVDGDDSWLNWCLTENFRMNKFSHTTQVKLKANHKVLILDTLEKILVFNRKFQFFSKDKNKKCFDFVNPDANLIDWIKVSEIYDGIIIPEYFGNLRLKLHWYYSWDCASGCIWNSRAISKLIPLNEKVEIECMTTPRTMAK